MARVEGKHDGKGGGEARWQGWRVAWATAACGMSAGSGGVDSCERQRLSEREGRASWHTQGSSGTWHCSSSRGLSTRAGTCAESNRSQCTHHRNRTTASMQLGRRVARSRACGICHAPSNRWGTREGCSRHRRTRVGSLQAAHAHGHRATAHRSSQWGESPSHPRRV